jgi:YD repeat-containing protein
MKFSTPAAMFLKSLPSRLSRLFLIGLLMSSPIFAAENVDFPEDDEEECKPCPCDGQGCATGSFHWFFSIGKTTYKKPDMLNVARKAVNKGGGSRGMGVSRVSERLMGQGANERPGEGAVPPTFDRAFKTSYRADDITNQATISFEINALDLTASLLQISSLKMPRSTSSEVIEQGGLIRQVRTSNTLVDVIPLTVGYRIKVYDRLSTGPKGSDGLYTTLGAISYRDAIIKTPNGAAFTNAIDVIFIDRKNAGGVRVDYHRFIRDQATDTQIKETYAATLVADFHAPGSDPYQPVMGELVEREVATFSARGTKPYDYTLVAETSRITTTAEGPQYGVLKLVGRRLETYRDLTPGSQGGDAKYKRLVTTVDGYNTPQARATTYSWYEQPSNLMVHGRLKEKVSPGGFWEFYEYTDNAGAAVHQQVKYSLWNTMPTFETLGITEAQIFESRKPYARKEVTSVSSTTNFTKVVSYGNVITGKEEFSSIPQSDGGLLNTLTNKSGSDVVLSIKTWKLNAESAPAYLAGRVAWIENPDGTAETYTYTDLSNGSFRLAHRKGAGSRNGVTSGVEITTEYNNFVQAGSESTKDITSGLTLNFWVAPTVDFTGRPTKIVYNGNEGDIEEFQYSCCGLERKRNRDGSVKTYARDPLKRVYVESDYRFAGDPAPLVTTVAYDGLTTTAKIGAVLSKETVVLLNGEVVTSRTPDEDGDGNPEAATIVTQYPSNGGRLVTKTNADGGTEIRTYLASGALKSVTGTAVPDVEYIYTTHNVSGGGLCTQVIKKSESSLSGEWQKFYKDGLDRIFRIETPGDFDANGLVDAQSYLFYDGVSSIPGSRGKLRFLTDADGKRITYSYNSRGDLGQISEQMSQSQNRVIVLNRTVVNDALLGVSSRTTSTVNGTLIEVALVSGDGYGRRTTRFDAVTTEIRSVSDVQGSSVITRTNPDNTKDLQVVTGNLITNVISKSTSGAQISAVTYVYDSFRRVYSTTDARTGTITNDTYTDAGRVSSLTRPGNRVTLFNYDVMGRQVSADQPNTFGATGNLLANLTHYSYYPTGLIKATWGDQATPVFYGYDEQNRMMLLRTYRNITPGVEPTSATSGFDSTTWNYDPSRGFLSSKRDAMSKGADYSYTATGRLKSRTWGRSTAALPVTTGYTYDKGYLTIIDYSDATPDVTTQFDAFGRKTSITQANQSQSIFTHDPVNLAVDTETVSYDIDHNGIYEFTRVFDRAAVSLGRDNGWELKNGSSVDNRTTYGYSPSDGRLSTVGGGGSVSPLSFSYGYLLNSNLLETTTATSGALHTVTNLWESDRDVLDLKQNKVGATMISSYDYSTNALGQRTAVVTGGSAFPNAPTWLWGYDSLGRITRADSNISGSDRAYEFDSAGNRKKSADSLTLPTADNYAANAVNQYSQITSNTSTVSPSYDDDGNVTACPVPAAPSANSALTWDGENRLTSITVNGTTTSYQYDALSRRIAKSSGATITLYVYDKWNCVAEYSHALGATPVSTILRTRLWGQDITGSMQGISFQWCSSR